MMTNHFVSNFEVTIHSEAFFSVVGIVIFCYFRLLVIIRVLFLFPGLFDLFLLLFHQFVQYFFKILVFLDAPVNCASLGEHKALFTYYLASLEWEHHYVAFLWEICLEFSHFLHFNKKAGRCIERIRRIQLFDTVILIEMRICVYLPHFGVKFILRVDGVLNGLKLLLLARKIRLESC